jgi:thioredoxin reductase (NADPH)
MEESRIYDLIILGGGPAGVSTAIYAARGMLNCIILEKMTTGGQLNWTQDIENYPGFTTIKGFELIEKFQEQLVTHNIPIEQFQEIQKVDLKSKIKTVTTLDKVFKAKTIVICTGASPRKLGVKGENEFIGRGVSYCAVCDGAFFKEKKVSIVGGGNSAAEEGLYLTRFASEVNIIHRRDTLRASRLYQKRLIDHPKLNFIWNTVVEEIQGTEKGVNNLVIRNVKTGEISNHKTDGIFPYIGTLPNTELFKDQIELDESGYLICKEDMSTILPGVFGAGDVRKTPLRQIVVSASDGAIAATSAIKYLDAVFEETTTTV